MIIGATDWLARRAADAAVIPIPMPTLLPEPSSSLSSSCRFSLSASPIGCRASEYVTGRSITYDQPVPFSHAHHVGGLGLDCRYCHTGVETSAVAGIPPTHTCMTCHSQLYTQTAMLAPVRESLADGQPIHWNKVNRLPDYVYFDHSIHVAKGVGCTTCHGDVATMPLMRQAAPLTMGWCLDCHRDPAPNLRPAAAVFDPDWKFPPIRPSAALPRASIHRQQTSHRLLGVPPMSAHGPQLTSADARSDRSPRGAEAFRQRRGAGAGVVRPSGRAGRALCRDAGAAKCPACRCGSRRALALAGYGRGVIVTSVEGRPIKIDGNPRHPASLGATDVFAEAAVLSLYDPDRSKAPRSGGRIQSWSAFEAALRSQLEQETPRHGAGLAILTGRVTSPTLIAQIGDSEKSLAGGEMVSLRAGRGRCHSRRRACKPSAAR